MIKKTLINLIKMYQRMPLSSHNQCKYIPSCSNYAIDAIEYYGAFKGTILAIWRILRCNPFSKGGVDPVIKK
ncbi:MAG: membrane protein insertion efficiency factor YidD [Bacilli bacterium]|nr:membrane protein insertion efficiency factor YidD [Bacilli bacterium]